MIVASYQLTSLICCNLGLLAGCEHARVEKVVEVWSGKSCGGVEWKKLWRCGVCYLDTCNERRWGWNHRLLNCWWMRLLQPAENAQQHEQHSGALFLRDGCGQVCSTLHSVWRQCEEACNIKSHIRGLCLPVHWIWAGVVYCMPQPMCSCPGCLFHGLLAEVVNNSFQIWSSFMVWEKGEEVCTHVQIICANRRQNLNR